MKTKHENHCDGCPLLRVDPGDELHSFGDSNRDEPWRSGGTFWRTYVPSENKYACLGYNKKLNKGSSPVKCMPCRKNEELVELTEDQEKRLLWHAEKKWSFVKDLKTGDKINL